MSTPSIKSASDSPSRTELLLLLVSVPAGPSLFLGWLDTGGAGSFLQWCGCGGSENFIFAFREKKTYEKLGK
jgi:hypothetical protein